MPPLGTGRSGFATLSPQSNPLPHPGGLDVLPYGPGGDSGPLPHDGLEGGQATQLLPGIPCEPFPIRVRFPLPRLALGFIESKPDGVLPLWVAEKRKDCPVGRGLSGHGDMVPGMIKTHHLKRFPRCPWVSWVLATKPNVSVARSARNNLWGSQASTLYYTLIGSVPTRKGGSRHTGSYVGCLRYMDHPPPIWI